jgi:hypothetical protein
MLILHNNEPLAPYLIHEKYFNERRSLGKGWLSLTECVRGANGSVVHVRRRFHESHK